MQNLKTLKTQTNQKQTTKRKIPYIKNGKGRENQDKCSALPIFKQKIIKLKKGGENENKSSLPSNIQKIHKFPENYIDWCHKINCTI